MKVFWPGYQIESHRNPWESARIVVELAKVGVECALELSHDCDAVFVGSISASEDAAGGYRKEPYRRYVAGYRQDQYKHVKSVQYCWDLYPWVVEDPNYSDTKRVAGYVDDLRHCDEVWVPSAPVNRRLYQYTGRYGVVMPVVISPWEPDEPPTDGGYVVDVMRRYPGDPNTGVVKSVCDELGVECRETGASMSWAEYKRTIANARLLVSAYREASTGSLALLDGYRLGIDVLVSDSEWNGAGEIFGDRAMKFLWDDRKSLKDSINFLANRKLVRLTTNWPDNTYGEPAFARAFADRIRKVVGC